jgi:hypothetical protein
MTTNKYINQWTHIGIGQPEDCRRTTNPHSGGRTRSTLSSGIHTNLSPVAISSLFRSPDGMVRVNSRFRGRGHRLSTNLFQYSVPYASFEQRQPSRPNGCPTQFSLSHRDSATYIASNSPGPMSPSWLHEKTLNTVVPTADHTRLHSISRPSTVSQSLPTAPCYSSKPARPLTWKSHIYVLFMA